MSRSNCINIGLVLSSTNVPDTADVFFTSLIGFSLLSSTNPAAKLINVLPSVIANRVFNFIASKSSSESTISTTTSSKEALSVSVKV